MLLGLKGRDRGGIGNSTSASAAIVQSGHVAMCGAGHRCGTSGDAACGCGNLPFAALSGGDSPYPIVPEAVPSVPTASAEKQPPTQPGVLGPSSGLRSAGRSLPGVDSKAGPLPFNPKTNLHSPLQHGNESIAPKGAAPSVPGLSGKG